MRALWVDRGNEPNWVLARRYGFDEIFIDARDGQYAKAEVFAYASTLGFRAGLYRAASWTPELSGQALAELAHRDLLRLASPLNPPYCIDIEYQDSAYVRAFFNTWRRLRPRRRCDWGLRPFQGGWVRELAGDLERWGIGVVPYHYLGDMSPCAADRVYADLAPYVRPPSYLWGFYDAALLPLHGWAGYAFTQGRLRG